MPTKAEYDAALALAEETNDATACEQFGMNKNTLRGERLRRKRKSARVPRELPDDRPSGDQQGGLWKLHDEAHDEERRARASVESCRKAGAASDARAFAIVAREASTRRRQLADEARAEREHRLRVEAAEAKLSVQQVRFIQDIYRLALEGLGFGWSSAHADYIVGCYRALRDGEPVENGDRRFTFPEPETVTVRAAIQAILTRQDEAEQREVEERGARSASSPGGDDDHGLDIEAIKAEVEAESRAETDPLAEVEGPNADAVATSKPNPHEKPTPSAESRGAPVQFADPVSEPAEATPTFRRFDR